jgi:hypothetical protein
VRSLTAQNAVSDRTHPLTYGWAVVIAYSGAPVLAAGIIGLVLAMLLLAVFVARGGTRTSVDESTDEVAPAARRADYDPVSRSRPPTDA